ncbi:hypothetical protein HMPREF9372_1581 [Sporosarcina newyorkensis 2681]|uniref:Uncharacterized protein n=1 Tax=Sporosarcina newyorkensis 2681 TaxID=1027292 RepID=F9DS01_9BACL|nr:hypothetical protein HMPREF9372_1581 [Sporosarcina newyorkensis 2681]
MEINLLVDAIQVPHFLSNLIIQADYENLTKASLFGKRNLL